MHQHPQVLLCRAALNPFITQSVSMFRIALTQMQDLSFGLDELHEVHVVSFLKPLKVPQDGIPSPQNVTCITQLGVICRLPEGALNLTVSFIKIVKSRSQY